tara:strand:+ start:181 stop:612 length:432 start_codon:yes stop_codon:yes gene_type:complete
MKKIYRDFITKEEAEKQFNNREFKYFINKNKNELVDKIINKLKEDFSFKIKDESYWRVEHRTKGHRWHKDTGSTNKMMWCQVGVSLILKDGNSGGETYYGKEENDKNPIKSDRKIYDLVAHTSDEWHMVTPHQGKRIVFLMFI